MATVQVWRYFRADQLGPGEERWVSFGPADALGNSALSVTAIPHDGVGEGGVYVLRVENINVWDVESDVASGFPIHEKFVGFTVKNNRETTTVTQWSISIGVITP